MPSLPDRPAKNGPQFICLSAANLICLLQKINRLFASENGRWPDLTFLRLPRAFEEPPLMPYLQPLFPGTPIADAIEGHLSKIATRNAGLSHKTGGMGLDAGLLRDIIVKTTF